MSRIPNVALACPVEIAPKRKMCIPIPPGVALDGEVYLEGPDGSLWRAEAISAHEAVAHEV